MNELLERPVFGKLETPRPILIACAEFPLESFERPQEFVKVHLQCAGDHTRGLFEADASIVVSACYPSKNVPIFFV